MPSWFKAAVTALVALLAAVSWVLGQEQIARWFAVCALQFAQYQFVWRLIRGPSALARETRAALHVVLLALPLLWSRVPDPVASPGLAFALGVVGALTLLLGLHRSELRLLYDREVVLLRGPASWQRIWSTWVWRAPYACLQELFYRGLLISLLRPAVGVWAVLISAGLFVLEHVVADWAQPIPTRRYVSHALVGLLFGTTYWITGNVWACVVGHLLLNLPSLLSPLYTRYLHHLNKFAQV